MRRQLLHKRFARATVAGPLWVKDPPRYLLSHLREPCLANIVGTDGQMQELKVGCLQLDEFYLQRHRIKFSLLGSGTEGHAPA